MQKIPIISLQSYKIIKKLGKGSFGLVYLVENTKETKNYAAKESNEEFDPLNRDASFFRELLSYSKSDNPAILYLFGYSNYNFQYQPYPTMIMDYMKNGSLDKILEKQRNCLSPSNFTTTKKYIILLGVAIGMKYLHSKGIIHRDLKPANILLDEDFYPRICDFGCSYISDKKLTQIRMNSNEGTPIYMAPEIFSDESYTYKIDVYAFAYFAFELITGNLPFSDIVNVFDLIEKVKNGMRPDLSLIDDQRIKSFLRKCWSSNPSERPSFSEIVNEIIQKEFQKSFGLIDEDEVIEYIEKFDEKLLKPEFYGIKDIKKLADEGNIEEMIYYGMILRGGFGVPSNKKEATKYFKKAADLGSTKAMILYALMIEDGDEKDQIESTKYIKMAADQGDSDGMVEYGIKLFYGRGVRMNKKEAAKYYKMALDLGNDEGMFKYAMMIDQGKFIQKNKNEAARLYKILVDKGRIDVMYIYGNMLANGDGVPTNVRQGLLYIKVAADNGYPEAMFIYGARLLLGNGIKQNCSLGIYYVKSAANKGYQRAIYFLNSLIESGNLLTLILNEKLNLNSNTQKYSSQNSNDINDENYEPEQEMNNLKQKADNGNSDAMLEYGLKLINNNNDDDDLIKKEGIKYIKLAAKNQNSNAMLCYGKMLYEGKEINKNKKEGIQQIKMSAEKQNTDAMIEYGKILINENKIKGVEIIKKLVDEGNIEANIVYGIMLIKGKCIEINESEAIKYFKFAADHENPDGMFYYGMMLYKGEGIGQNKKEGKHYIKMAADKQYEKAIVFYDYINKNDENNQTDQKNQNLLWKIFIILCIFVPIIAYLIRYFIKYS